MIVPGPPAPGEKNDTQALQRAIDLAYERGGGTVYLAGRSYVSGTLLLRSNVSLWLDTGAILMASASNADFLPIEKLPYNPYADQNTSDFHQSLIVADGVEHVGIFGGGVIDGNRSGSGGPKSIALRRCHHVTVRGITIRNSSNRALSMLGCNYVEIDGVTIQNCYSDGIDPDCSRFVRISNCYVESVDDSMCLKTSGALGERRSTEYITVDNCVLRTASIHFKCGTESCGDFRSIVFSNCVLQGGMGDRHGNPGIALYTTDGGALVDVAISNIVMHDVGVPLALIRGDRDRCVYGGGPGVLESVRISNVIASGVRLPSVIVGLPDSPVEGIAIDGFSVKMAKAEAGPSDLDAVPERPKEYPQPVAFGPLPAFGLFVRHAKRISLRDVELEPAPGELRAAIVADDAADVDLLGYEDRAAGPSRLWLRNLRGSTVDVLHPGSLPYGAIRVEGDKSADLTCIPSSDELERERVLAIGASVRAQAIHGLSRNQ